jgi:hypothetical protein
MPEQGRMDQRDDSARYILNYILIISQIIPFGKTNSYNSSTKSQKLRESARKRTYIRPAKRFPG